MTGGAAPGWRGSQRFQAALHAFWRLPGDVFPSGGEEIWATACRIP